MDDISPFPDVSDTTSRLELATFFHALCLRPVPAHVKVSEARDSIKRACSTRTSYDDVRALVGSSIQTVFVLEALAREAKTLGQLLYILGIRIHTVAPEKYPGRFQALALNPRILERHVVRLWEDFVQISTLAGLIGRVSYFALSKRQYRIRKSWRSELLGELEVADIRRLAILLSVNGAPPSPYGSDTLRLL